MENDIVLGEKMVNKKENVFKEAYSIYNTVLAVINGRKLYVFCMVFVVVSGGVGQQALRRFTSSSSVGPIANGEYN